MPNDKSPAYLRCLVALSVLILSACTDAPVRKGEAVAAAGLIDMVPLPMATPPSEAVYHFQTGDVMDVKFAFNPELNENLVVRPDGKVSLQFVGDIMAAGNSPTELQAALVERYRAILPKPEIVVIVRKFAPQRIYVGGHVQAPGMLTLEGQTTVLQAIVQAGGFGPGSQPDNVFVLRRKGDKDVELINLNLDSRSIDLWRDPPLKPCAKTTVETTCLEREKPERYAMSDIYLAPMDIVIVPQRPIARVAEFFDQYINKILPIYRNMGFSFSYDLNPEVRVRQ